MTIVSARIIRVTKSGRKYSMPEASDRVEINSLEAWAQLCTRHFNGNYIIEYNPFCEVEEVDENEAKNGIIYGGYVYFVGKSWPNRYYRDVKDLCTPETARPIEVFVKRI